MTLSVIVPTFEAEDTIPDLLESLANQSYTDFEVIVVDDDSKDGTVEAAKYYRCATIQLDRNRGPAHCRNIGAKKAKGEILVFTDSDCTVDSQWLETIKQHFSVNEAEAVMGRLILMPSTLLGDSISALGFPAGGSLGFDKMWKVDRAGYTSSLSSCNCAIKKEIFLDVGGFDESFPFPGGEDTLLAYNLISQNYRIRYCPDIIAYHKARDSLVDFVRWQYKRGMSSHIFSRKVSNKIDFGRLRMWSTVNIIRHYFADKKFPLILFLLVTSSSVQLLGFLSSKYKR